MSQNNSFLFSGCAVELVVSLVKYCLLKISVNVCILDVFMSEEILDVVGILCSVIFQGGFPMSKCVEVNLQ